MNQQNEIILFENQGVKLEVNMKDETVWLSVKQMAELFDREESNIRRHIINIFKEQELIEANNVQNLHVDGVKQKVPFYNLDVIISVGYRVKSQKGRSNIRLGEYLIETRNVKHGKIKPSFGYIVHKVDKKVGFSGDSMYCPAIDKIVEDSDVSILDMSLKAEGNHSHMGYLDMKDICYKYKDKTIIATHMHNSARQVALENPIENLIIPKENQEIIL